MARYVAPTLEVMESAPLTLSQIYIQRFCKSVRHDPTDPCHPHRQNPSSLGTSNEHASPPEQKKMESNTCHGVMGLHTFFDDNPLVSATLKPSTRKLYLKAYKRFAASRNIQEQNSSLRQGMVGTRLSAVLAAYIQKNFRESPRPGRKQQMSNLLSFLSLAMPESKKHFCIAKRALKGWGLIVPSKASLPLTRDYMLAFVQYLLDKKRCISAVALAAQWGCYARASEILKLIIQDIALPGDIRTAQFNCRAIGVNIKCSKTGKEQFTQVRDAGIIALIESYMQRSKRSGLVFPVTYANYLQDIKSAAQFFQLSSRITTHSACIGGALHAFCQGLPAADIATIGRWASLASLQYYLTNGRSWLMTMPTGPLSDVRLRRHTANGKSTIARCEAFVQSVCKTVGSDALATIDN